MNSRCLKNLFFFNKSFAFRNHSEIRNQIMLLKLNLIELKKLQLGLLKTQNVVFFKIKFEEYILIIFFYWKGVNYSDYVRLPLSTRHIIALLRDQ